jgi:hypothetical protein
MPRFQDLTGRRFGKLIVIRRAENGASGRVQWLCQCECSNITVAIANNMKRGKTGACVSAGKQATRIGERNRAHGRITNAYGGLGSAFASAQFEKFFSPMCMSAEHQTQQLASFPSIKPNVLAS